MERAFAVKELMYDVIIREVHANFNLKGSDL